MKQLVTTTALAIFSLPNLFSASYYFASSSTSATEDGSITNPYKTLAAFNFNSLAAGDYVYFKSGDVFRGQISLTVSGSSGAPITFTTYGGSAKATISGAEKYTTWINSSGLYTVAIASTVRNFFINDVEATLARYPNGDGFLTLDAGSTNATILDGAVSNTAGYWNGASICVHSKQWCWEKSVISSYASGSFSLSTPMTQTPLTNYSYFLYDKLEECDTEGEWFYGSGTLYYKTAIDPNTSGANLEASLYDAGIKLGSNFLSCSHINISNLNFDKQYEAGIWFSNSSNSHITIDNCSFYRQYKHGISTDGSIHTITNSYFSACDASGITLNGSNQTVSYCSFYDIGKYRNSGIGGETNLTAIKSNFAATCHIHHNTIDRAGYCGISADGSNHIVEKNILSNCMLLNNDGAALKAFGVASTGTIFRNNFISNTHGNTAGAFNATFKTPAIYLDFNSNNITIQDNTIYNCSQKGIFLNGGTHTNTVTGNIVLGSEFGIDFNAVTQPTLMRNVNVQNNVFFALTTTAVNIRQAPTQADDYNFGTINNNYYFQPYNASRVALRVPSSYYTFSDWQAQPEGFDANTKSSFVSWTLPTNYSELFTNPTDAVVNQPLTGQYKDLDGNAVCGSISLQPYTARLLINQNTNCTTPVELLDFTARLKNAVVVLNWQTATETDNAYFVIERRTDTETWTDIGKVIGQGQSQKKQTYQFEDTEPLSGILYYRLRQIDAGGQAHLSKTVSVRMVKGHFDIVPNPTSDKCRLIFLEKNADILRGQSEYVLTLQNSVGLVLQNHELTELDTYELDLSAYPAGIYLVSVRQNGLLFLKKILKR
jgi:parallel beta-helix repeat protein